MSNYTIRDFVLATLEEALEYQHRFQAEIERLEGEGWTLTIGGPEEYRVWRTAELLFSAPGFEDFAAVEKFGIKPYHLDWVLADEDAIVPLVPGLPAKLAQEMQCAVWDLAEEDMPTLADYIGWPLEKVKFALQSVTLRSSLDGPETAGT